MKFKMIHENYNVSDLERSMRFYEEALGLKEARRKTGDDYIIVYLSNAEAEFELELTWLKDHPQKYDLGEEEFHLAFRTDDFEAAHALKGVLGNLALTPMFKPASSLCEALRGRTGEDYNAMYEELTQARNAFLELGK